MTRVQPKATPNWCPQGKPDEPWTGHCVKEKIADDGKRHRCPNRRSIVTTCMLPVQCGVEAILGEYPPGALPPAIG
jgi:hypothetical protein